VVLFNENEREIWPKGLFRSRFPILGQAPKSLTLDIRPSIPPGLAEHIFVSGARRVLFP
jgi:hypothetical protein